MSLSTIFNSIDQYIKIKPWLQFVGYMLIAGNLVLTATMLWLQHPNLVAAGLLGAFVGLGISMAGFDYSKIYP